MFRVCRLRACVCAAVLLLPAIAHTQIFNLSKDQLIELTAKNPFERFPDGRPKVPDAMMERARGLSAEEVFAVLSAEKSGFRNQYADGFHVLYPTKKMVGRAFTVQFMPLRQDMEDVAQAHAKAAGHAYLKNQTAIDMLQPGDVLVVDLFGKSEDGTIVGDNLFYYVMKATKSGGIVADGAIRDLEGIQSMDMPLYYRSAHPSFLTNVTLTGINIPVRIGNVTVMPGDLVVGDPEGVYFIPPQMVERVLDSADRVHVHDEWTRKKFDEGKYKSTQIYASPSDPALVKEYEEYLKKRLEELHKKQ